MKRLARHALLVLSVLAIMLAWLFGVAMREAGRQPRDVATDPAGYPMPVD